MRESGLLATCLPIIMPAVVVVVSQETTLHKFKLQSFPPFLTPPPSLFLFFSFLFFFLGWGQGGGGGWVGEERGGDQSRRRCPPERGVWGTKSPPPPYLYLC